MASSFIRLGEGHGGSITCSLSRLRERVGERAGVLMRTAASFHHRETRSAAAIQYASIELKFWIA
jgi:hypothetical protein